MTFNEMQTDIINTWLADLRSGNFKQGKSFLKRGDEYCCLGVLAERASKRSDFPLDFAPASRYKDTSACRNRHDPEDFSEGLIPDSLWKRLGFDARFRAQLVNINDGGTGTFPEIADIIEAHVMNLDPSFQLATKETSNDN